MMHVEYASPAVRYFVERTLDRRAVRWASLGIPDINRAVDPLLAEMRALGLLVHDAGDRVIVTAGGCDLDGAWARAREVTRIRCLREHAQAVERIADRDAARRERKARDAARRSRRVEDEDLAAFAP